MSYASIDNDYSHRQSKKFKQRLKYRLDQGYTLDEAEELASVKLRVLSGRTEAHKIPKSSCSSDETYPQKNDQLSGSFRPSENSSFLQNPCLAMVFSEPTPGEIRLEIERLKAAGQMTETSSRTEIISSASYVESPPRKENETSSNLPFTTKTWPFWAISILASLWLVSSMLSSLSGRWFFNLPIAIAFAFGPLLLLGAKLNPKASKVAFWGAVWLFSLDISLYLVPSVKKLWNEASLYSEALSRYEQLSTEFKAESQNLASLTAKAKTRSDDAENAYRKAFENYGASSWRTVQTKNTFDQEFKTWEDRSKGLELRKAPEILTISEELTAAAQAIIVRIGLFAVVILLMFVKRQI